MSELGEVLYTLRGYESVLEMCILTALQRDQVICRIGVLKRHLGDAVVPPIPDGVMGVKWKVPVDNIEDLPEDDKELTARVVGYDDNRRTFIKVYNIGWVPVKSFPPLDIHPPNVRNCTERGMNKVIEVQGFSDCLFLYRRPFVDRAEDAQCNVRSSLGENVKCVGIVDKDCPLVKYEEITVKAKVRQGRG